MKISCVWKFEVSRITIKMINWPGQSYLVQVSWQTQVDNILEGTKTNSQYFPISLYVNTIKYKNIKYKNISVHEARHIKHLKSVQTQFIKSVQTQFIKSCIVLAVCQEDKNSTL